MSVTASLLRLGALLRDNLQMGAFSWHRRMFLLASIDQRRCRMHSQDCDISSMLVFQFEKTLLRPCLFGSRRRCRLREPQPIGLSSV